MQLMTMASGIDGHEGGREIVRRSSGRVAWRISRLHKERDE